MASTDACGDRPAERVSQECEVDSAAVRTMAHVLALGGLATMIGGIGYQIGRGSGQVTQIPPSGYGAPVPPQAPHPPYPAPGATPPPENPGQWQAG
ncbi:hypothetical protein ABZ897_48545 [Nonomuraea sp. NPDC046802]|uniref:hypothetical protein n=1 Tax=Nonomuraea sp. NPDC046802 TaxID=3154919 RepID=UPI00340767E1